MTFDHIDHSMNVSEVFLVYSTYTTIIILKMMMMSFLTAFFRGSRGAFENPEDIAEKTREDKYKLLRTHPDVERVRRCHQNDLENIVPFVLIGLLYSLTGPDVSSALIHFRVFVASRLCHTVAYVAPLPQPSRVLTWLLGVLVTLSMSYRVLRTTFHL